MKNEFYFKGNYHYIIDFWKFVFSIIIVIHHIYNLGFEIGSYHFFNGWIYVEFFFLVSGYFTMFHFQNENTNIDLNEKSNIALKYTIKKFKPLVVYIFFSISINYILMNKDVIASGNIRDIIISFADMPFELFLLTSGILGVFPKLVPIWYLSSMFLVFPLFILIIQNKNRKFLFIISYSIPLFYYGFTGVIGKREWPHDLLRAFSCMLLGVFVFFVSKRIEKQNFGKRFRIFLTIIEILCLLFTVYSTYENLEILRINFLFFIISLVILFSKQSYSYYIRINFFKFLGELSTSIFLFHWVSGTIVNKFFGNENLRAKFYLYLMGVVFLSLFFYFFAKKINKSLSLICKRS